MLFCRYLLMREVLILLNRLASHANFSKPTLEVLTSSKLCATLTIDVANQLPQRSKYPLRHLGEINIQMANDLAELAQKFRTRVHSFLEEQHSTVDHSNPSALHESWQLPGCAKSRRLTVLPPISWVQITAKAARGTISRASGEIL